MKTNLSDKYTINLNPNTIHAAYPYYGEREIGESFTNIAGDNYIVITPAQAESFAKVTEHQGHENLISIFMPSFDKYLGLQFHHITIGIEPDGYAHS